MNQTSAQTIWTSRERIGRVANDTTQLSIRNEALFQFITLLYIYVEVVSFTMIINYDYFGFLIIHDLTQEYDKTKSSVFLSSNFMLKNSDT